MYHWNRHTIQEKLLSLSLYIPCEFARKPCSLSDIIRWKATEFRQFFVIDRPVVLRCVLPEPLYENFILPIFVAPDSV